MKKLCTIMLILLFSIGILLAQADNKKMPDLQSLDCMTCHTCEKPTAKDPCLSDCPRFGLMTVHHSPDEAPDVIVLDILTNLCACDVFS